mgnify:FL=1
MCVAIIKQFNFSMRQMERYIRVMKIIEMGDAIVADKRIQLFGSKEYHFLSWLKSQERETSRGAAVNFSQEEIAAEYGSSPATINKWLRELQSVGCVEQQKKAVTISPKPEMQ